MGLKILLLAIVLGGWPLISGGDTEIIHIKADKHKAYLVHPTPEEQEQAEQNCKDQPTLMGCNDPYYY